MIRPVTTTTARTQLRSLVPLITSSTSLIRASSRFNSTIVSKAKYEYSDKIDFSKNPVYLVSIPITTKRNFVYCKYSSDAFPTGTESLETKAVNWASKAWSKLEKSDAKVNKSIVNLISKLQSKIPWIETCLRSVPSKSSMMRSIVSTSDPSSSPATKFVDEKEIEKSNLNSKDLESIPIYFPKQLTSQSTILKQISDSHNKLQAYHKKWLYWDLIGIPLSAPIAIIPLVPNVPCFYLCYRAYCHFTALKGLDHLNYLTGNQGKEDNHLEFHGLTFIEELYLNSLDSEIKQNVIEFVKNKDSAAINSEAEERLLVSKDVIEELCHAFGADDMKQGLQFAMEQETRRLNALKVKEAA